MRQHTSRFVSWLVALVLVLTGLGAFSPARADGSSLGTAYVSISLNESYVVSDGAVDGVHMAYVPVPLDEVKANYDLATFDNKKYEQYQKINDDGSVYEGVTLLQVYLYVLDKYYSGTSSEHRN